MEDAVHDQRVVAAVVVAVVFAVVLVVLSYSEERSRSALCSHGVLPRKLQLEYSI